MKKNLKSGLQKIKSVFKSNKRHPKIAKNPKGRNRKLVQQRKVTKDLRARERAEYLSSLPKNPVKRILYRLHPKRVYGFFTSRHGIILSLKVLGVFMAILAVLLLAIFAYYRKDLPKNLTDLKTCSEGASTLYYDRTGQTLLWASSGDVECTPVPLEEISPHLRNAVVVAEDKDFYKHGGFSVTGFTRAAWNNLWGKSTQGGSTITQQFVKNSLLTQERSIERKLKELILSIELERTYSKDTILNAYLNEIPFGSVYYGAEAASRGYFGKPSKDLTADEAAMLAAIIPRPTYYLPTGPNTKELMDRRNYILYLMKDQGLISQEEAEAAAATDTLAKIVPTKAKYSSIIAPHFVLEAQTRLEEEYGASSIMKAGYKVTTTLDLTQQKYAEEAIANNIYRVDSDGGDNAALSSVEVATGQVVAQVGSRDFNNVEYGELNMATTPRSPGSSFKPYDYASLFTNTQNWGPGSTVYDLVTNFGGGYTPRDYDFKEPGAMSVRNALGGSRNIPAIKAMYIAGVDKTIDLAKKLGVVSGSSCEPECGLSSAIGDGSEIRLDEHVNAFATFSRMGVYKPLTYILKVEDSRGKVLQEWKDTKGEQVLDPQVAYLINDILSDDSARYIRGSGNFNLPGITTALKTGTTNNMDNGWLMMYSTKYAAGTWIGNHKNTALWCGRNGCMEGKTGPIVAEYMKKAHQGVAGSGDRWTQPSGIKTLCIDRISGFAATSGGECDKFPSWYIPQKPDSSQKATIDIISNKLATSCTPESAKSEITGGGIRSEIPTSDPYYNNWRQPIMARYGSVVGGMVPTVNDDIHSCDVADLPSISVDHVIEKPNGSNKYEITVSFKQGKYPLSYNGRTSTVNIKVDGSIISGGSFTVTENGEVKATYEPATDTTKFTVTAEITDSVLYSNQSSPVDVTVN